MSLMTLKKNLSLISDGKLMEAQEELDRTRSSPEMRFIRHFFSAFEQYVAELLEEEVQELRRPKQ